MGLTDFVYRRGASYIWRRRLPRLLGGALIQVSLRTNDPLIARRIAAIVTVASNNLFERMTNTGLSRENARKLLDQVIREEIDRIQARKAVEMDDSADNAWTDNTSHDRMAARAYRLLAERGRSASLRPEEIDAIRSEGVGKDDLERLSGYLDLFGRDYWSEGRMARIKTQLRELLGIDPASAFAMAQGRQIMLRGRAAAHQLMVDQAGVDMAYADELAAQILDEQYRSAPAATPPASPIAPVTHLPTEIHAAPASLPVAEEEQLFDPDFMAVTDRMLDGKGNNVSEEMKTQMRGVAMLFVEATSVTDIRALRQGHVARFIEMLRALPKSYRKSPKDREKTLAQILADGQGLPADKIGMSEATINRNLGYIGQIIRRAKSEGILISQTIDLGLLHVKETKRERDKRLPFSPEDIAAIFQSPVWHGYRSPKRRHTPGNILTKDGLYWVPLIGVYTGARREEIAALMVDEIIEVNGIWCFDIKDNENRGLKTESSPRLVPIHSHLLELGLVQHRDEVVRRKNKNLFPDLTPTNNSDSFGDKIDYMWRQIMIKQLGERPKNKVFHSFRHYAINCFKRDPEVDKQTEKDIVGHAGEDVNEEVYGESMPVDMMQHAIERLPRVFR